MLPRQRSSRKSISVGLAYVEVIVPHVIESIVDSLYVVLALICTEVVSSATTYQKAILPKGPVQRLHRCTQVENAGGGWHPRPRVVCTKPYFIKRFFF
jgi:hypothetical protein